MRCVSNFKLCFHIYFRTSPSCLVDRWDEEVLRSLANGPFPDCEAPHIIPTMFDHLQGDEVEVTCTGLGMLTSGITLHKAEGSETTPDTRDILAMGLGVREVSSLLFFLSTSSLDLLVFLLILMPWLQRTN